MQQERWGHWRSQPRSGEAARLVRAWYRRVERSACKAAVGRAGRAPSARLAVGARLESRPKGGQG